jgi:hypothetical protein
MEFNLSQLISDEDVFFSPAVISEAMLPDSLALCSESKDLGRGN